MSLNCFFGLELHPDGIPVSPVIPPKSKLVLTHCAVTALHSSPTSPTTSSSRDVNHPRTTRTKKPPTTTDAEKRVEGGAEDHRNGPRGREEMEASSGTLCEGAVTLYAHQAGLPTSFAVCTLSVLNGLTYAPLDLLFTGNATFTLKKSSNGGSSGTTVVGDHSAYPSVHLTGYYEQEMEMDEGDSDDEDNEEFTVTL